MKISFETAEDVELAFYRAIENKDIELMSALWLDDVNVACVHPMGARLQGRQAVLESWQQIFGGDNRLTFELEGIEQQQVDRLSVHVLHELITPDKKREKRTTVIATNVYRQTGNGAWYMVLHHASLSPRTVADRKVKAGGDTVLH